MWTGGAWVVRDLASRNGTFVDGARIDPGGSRTLSAGARIGFGRADPTWELVDAGAPSAVAHDGADLRVAEGGVLALPDATSPEVVVYADARGRWVAEREGELSPIADGAAVVAGGRSWTIGLPSHVDGTATVDTGPTLDSIRLRFGVSRNEEHVRIEVLHRGRAEALEPREHGYVLLTLARARLADRALPLSEQGWLERDVLLKMLGVDSNALNVAIYRARGQLGAAGVDAAAGVVEVRRRQRRLGLEPARIEIGPL